MTARTAVCIGVFDGVHIGHRALVAECRTLAGSGGTVVAATFHPHPGHVLRPHGAPETLATLADRIALLRAAGADDVRVLRFTPGFAAMPPEAFADLVRDELAPAAVVVGDNFRFGAMAAGDAATLRELGAARGFEVRTLMLDEGGERVSSTRIRESLREGDVEGAWRLLARPYRLRGIVEHGDARGRELGYPTANLVPDASSGTPAVPADGVYAGWLTAEGAPMPAAISIGTNPQFGGDDRRIEAYVLDEEGLALYGKRIALDFAARLRGQAVFPSLDGLLAQMAADVEATREAVGGRSPGW